jgi:hypothetical protein
MPEEMVTRTADSPAAATGESGMMNAVRDFIQENAAPGDNSQWATSEHDGQAASQDYDGGYEDNNYDDILDEVLGINRTVTPQEPDEQPGAVPYERFREVNEKARQLQDVESKLSKWSSVIEQLESQGYGDAEAVLAAQAEQAAKAEEAQLRQYYQGLVDQQGLDPNVAQMQMEAQLSKMQYERQMEEVNNYMMMQQRDVALEQFPLAARAPALVDNLIAAGYDPYQAVEAVHEQVRTIVSSLVPEVAAKVSQGRRAPQPIGQSGSPRMAPVNNGQQRRAGWSDLLGINRGRNSL